MDGADPAPLAAPCEPIEGDSHAHLLTGLENLAAELGYTVRELPPQGSVKGWCDPERHEIVVSEGISLNGQVRVLVHELAHALGVGYEEFGRARAETIVDAVTYLVLRSAGLDVSCESVAYLASWGGEDAVKTVRETAELIDRIARRIEQAIAPEDTEVAA